MVQLDQEDINFLVELAKELRRIDLKLYGAEADELDNIVFRATNGNIVSVSDLVCDDCNPVEEECDDEFLALASLGKGNKFLEGK